jgi:hypothetical protein
MPGKLGPAASREYPMQSWVVERKTLLDEERSESRQVLCHVAVAVDDGVSEAGMDL